MSSEVHIDGNEARFRNDWLASTQLYMLFTVSAKASAFDGLSNIASTANVTVSGFDQNAPINLLTCRNSELMAGSQYPQTTRSLLKTGLLFIYHITSVLFSR